MPFEAAPGADVCSTCHRPLTQRGVDGECLRCLFAIALSPAGDEPVPDDPRSASAGTHRYGPFEIIAAEDGSLQELGAGAMGVTYRAQDSVLDRVVALKVIERRFAADRATRARFLREARSAARLRHPNVASVFHYGEQDGECFYAMELVEGETLEQRVRRSGPMPVPVALEVAAQVARALAAAEAEGIVHRDLKPGNIMLASSGGDGSVLVKVIDFGLAKTVVSGATAPGGPSDTRGGFVGTPAFASPEQFTRGADERIDTRSDIYSLGVTLWFLLCGKTPFVGESLAQVQARQREPLPVSQLQAARVPGPLVGLLRAMLAVDPAGRQQSARELLAAVESCRRRVAAKARRTSRFRAALLVLAGLAVIVGAGLWWQHASKLARSMDRSVAVLPFENLSPDESVAFFTDGVQLEVQRELARIAQLTVVRADGAHAGPPGKRDLAAIGRALGVTHLVEGSVQRQGGTLRVMVRLVDVHDQSHPWSKQYDGKVADVFAIQREITREVATRLRANLSAGEQSALDQPLTADPLAYDLYLRAYQVGDQFKGVVALRKGMATKIALLNEAVERDPKFVEAYCLLAECHDEVASAGTEGATPEERAVDHTGLAEIALDKARLINPNSGRLHLAQAHRLLMVSRQPQQALIDVDLARQTLPNSADLEQVAGIINMRLGRWDDAVRTLERANVLEPHVTIILKSLAWVYADVRRYDDEDRVLSQLLELRPADQRTPERLRRAAIALDARGDLEPLRAELKVASPTDDDDREWVAQYTLHLAILSRDAAAASDVLKSMTPTMLEDEDQPKAWYEGIVARSKGDEAAAHAAFAAARNEMEQRLARDPNGYNAVSGLGLVDAMLGRKEEAGNEGRRACELLASRKNTARAVAMSCRLAAIYTWTGQPDRAFAVLDETAGQVASSYASLAYELTYGDLKLNPIWDPLRGDPRFASLLQKLSPPAKK